jgi:large subunit ribosomal protein L29
MKQSEITGMSDAELKDRLTEEKAQLTKLQLNHSVSPIENPLKIRTTRRTIARSLTEMGSRKRKSA